MVAVSVFHSKTATAPDDPAYAIVPTDWNSLHRASAQLQGADFANSNNVTFGVDTNGVVTASVVPGGGGSTSVFANSNGVSWGTAGSTVTATVRTDYQSSGAYLTTAALSQDSSKYAGINFAGTNISGTLNTSGLSLSVGAGAVATSLSFANSNGVSWGINASTITATVKTDYQTSGAYLTTAALSQDSSKYAGTSTGMTGGSVTLNTSGIAINLPAYLTTAQSPGAYLTTAALSQDSSKYAGTSTGMTGGSVTLNTSGIAINLPAYLTTADLSQNSSLYAGIGFTSTTTAGTAMKGTHNTAGLSVANPAWIIAMGVTAGTASNNVIGISFSDASGVTWGMTSRTITATVKTDYLTGAVGFGTSATNASVTLNSQGLAISVAAPGAATNAVGLGTAQTNVTWTVNSNGISLNAGGYNGTGLTSTTTAGTAIVGTNNTAGLSIGVPAFLTTAALSGDSSKYAGTGTSATNASITLNTNGLAISVAAPGGAGATISYLRYPDVWASLGSLAMSNSTAVRYVWPVPVLQNISVGYVRLPISLGVGGSTSFVTTANTTFSGSIAQTYFLVVYSLGTGASSQSLQSVASGSVGLSQTYNLQANANGTQFSTTMGITFPGSGANQNYSTSLAQSTSVFSINTSNLSQFMGQRQLDIGLSALLTPGQYWFGFAFSSTSSTQGNAGLTGGSGIQFQRVYQVIQTNLQFNQMGSATNSSNGLHLGIGSWSTNAQGTTASIGLASISSSASNPLIPVELISGI